jgi:hypothetical protein
MGSLGTSARREALDIDVIDPPQRERYRKPKGESKEVARWSVHAWTSLGEVEMSVHGYVAMILGIIFSLLVGCGLMALVFYSSRRGYDEPPDVR